MGREQYTLSAALPIRLIYTMARKTPFDNMRSPLTFAPHHLAVQSISGTI
jgi:hypothetical protein